MHFINHSVGFRFHEVKDQAHFNTEASIKSFNVMEFDPENKINKLCAQGMQLEGEGKPEEAADLFLKAWHEATNPIEKFTAAHYVARHQDTVAGKLKWDETALAIATEIDSENIKTVYPSLYLNVAKGYEDLEDYTEAAKYYRLALDYTSLSANDGYDNMISAGIHKGVERLRKLNPNG